MTESPQTSPLFMPFSAGRMALPNRIVMAPMTRSRSSQPGDVPNELMATYYAQRASAGLIVSEATQVSAQGQGYSFTPGIHTVAQTKGWRTVTDAVHAAGGRMVAQLWHVGRMSHASFHGGGRPIAPSALAPDARVWVADADGVGHMVECPLPRAMTATDISQAIDEFRRAASRAMEAGFDGVEIHGGNGYLIDQFLRTTSNHRTDSWGGSIEARTRFAREVATAVAQEVGVQRTGMRLAPFITQRNMNCPEIIPAVLSLAASLGNMGLAYLHLAEADWDDAPQVPDVFRRELRRVFDGAIIVAGRYDQTRAEAMLRAGLADLVAFGRPFIANPDLPLRMARNLPLSSFDGSTLFGGGAKGYIDYVSLAPQSTNTF